MDSGYFNDLGVTALWLTPVVKNVWRSGYDLGGWKAGYHGYWAQDWLDIDPHLTSRESLTGEAYSDDAEGRMEHYRDFVKLAHSKGIKVIQDVVLNHAGPVFYYDVNSDGVFDVSRKDACGTRLHCRDADEAGARGEVDDALALNDLGMVQHVTRQRLTAGPGESPEGRLDPLRTQPGLGRLPDRHVLGGGGDRDGRGGGAGDGRQGALAALVTACGKGGAASADGSKGPKQPTGG